MKINSYTIEPKADLRGANLRGANLTAVKNFILLPIQDPRGWMPIYATNTGDGWIICSGCRRLSIPDALAHWSNPNHSRPEIAGQYLTAIRWLQRKIESESIEFEMKQEAAA